MFEWIFKVLQDFVYWLGGDWLESWLDVIWTWFVGHFPEHTVNDASVLVEWVARLNYFVPIGELAAALFLIWNFQLWVWTTKAVWRFVPEVGA